MQDKTVWRYTCEISFVRGLRSPPFAPSLAADEKAHRTLQRSVTKFAVTCPETAIVAPCANPCAVDPACQRSAMAHLRDLTCFPHVGRPRATFVPTMLASLATHNDQLMGCSSAAVRYTYVTTSCNSAAIASSTHHPMCKLKSARSLQALESSIEVG